MSDIPINQIVNVNISIAGGGAQAGDFGLACLWGTSQTITPTQRYQSFSTLPEVAAVFSSFSEEYKAAEILFSPNPAPPKLYIARWIESAAAGYLKTALTSTALSTLISITDGSLRIGFNGVSQDITGLDFTAVTTWADVAEVIEDGIQAIGSGGFTAATVVAVQSSLGVQFIFTSGTTGVGSTVTVPTAAGSGTDLVSLLSLGTGTPVAGAAAETAVQAVQAVQALNDSFFGMLFTNSLRDSSDVLTLAAYVQTLPKAYFTVTQDANTIIPDDTTSYAYQSKQLGYSHTLFIYSDVDQYADASIMSTMFTVDFSGVNTVKNAKFQAMPGILPVNLTSAQLNALEAVNCNTIISVKGIAFFSDGRMSGDESSQTYYFDTMHFQYWLQDYIQTNVLNLFLSKDVPYSDQGVQMEVQVLSNSLQQGVINGGLSPLLGESNTTIPAYVVLQPPRVATIPSSQRTARISPTLQFTANGSDAINSVTINGVLTA